MAANGAALIDVAGGKSGGYLTHDRLPSFGRFRRSRFAN
jgi:hypothetical protein